MPKKGGGGGERRTGRTSIIKIVSQITYGNKRAASEERPPAVKESGIKKKKTKHSEEGTELRSLLRKHKPGQHHIPVLYPDTMIRTVHKTHTHKQTQSKWWRERAESEGKHIIVVQQSRGICST